MVGIMAKGDVKEVTKVLTAIAYFYKNCTVVDVMARTAHFTDEQKKRWCKLFVALYDQMMEGACRPNGEDCFPIYEPKFDEEDKPF